MPFKVVYMSCSQWPGTELDSGDTGILHETKEEAQAEAKAIENNPNNDIMNAAIEAQGVEGWLEIVEVQD